MKKKLLSIFFIINSLAAYSQAIDVESMLNIISMSEQKIETQLQKKGFGYAGVLLKNDTTIKTYNFLQEQISNTKKIADSGLRKIKKSICKGDLMLTYQTKYLHEINNLKKELKMAGFYCSLENDTSHLSLSNTILYQHKNITATISESIEDSTILYAIEFHRKSFPDSKNMYYADDLLNFTSHEYLAYYFGDDNVKKDIYFFSGNEIAKCSVLFTGTNRQVVFIWEDEANKRTISNLLFGGQQKLKSLMDQDKYVAESSWLLRSGLYAGMSLYELRKLNGADFSFYAGNAINSGLVLDDNKGNLNFKRENIILGCINCNDDKYKATSIMSVDQAMEEGRILFVLSVVLNPPHPITTN